jgi:hypothetical protein
MAEPASHAVIYYTHFVSPSVTRQIEGLNRALRPAFNLFAVGCCPENSTLDELAGERISARSYLRDELRLLPYPRQLMGVNWETMRCSADLALMRFFQGNPAFDYYWVVEYDVRFSGNWESLFCELSESSADLLCTYLTTHDEGRDWVHWQSFLSPGTPVGEADLLRGFFPFSRLSGRLMRAIDERCRIGWAGHYEVLWPTIARTIGASIEEIGGHGSFVPDSRRGRYYEGAITPAGHFLSTFGAWPSYSDRNSFGQAAWPDLLWHPVKE